MNAINKKIIIKNTIRNILEPKKLNYREITHEEGLDRNNIVKLYQIIIKSNIAEILLMKLRSNNTIGNNLKV